MPITDLTRSERVRYLTAQISETRTQILLEVWIMYSRTWVALSTKCSRNPIKYLRIITYSELEHVRGSNSYKLKWRTLIFKRMTTLIFSFITCSQCINYPTVKGPPTYDNWPSARFISRWMSMEFLVGASVLEKISVFVMTMFLWISALCRLADRCTWRPNPK